DEHRRQQRRDPVDEREGLLRNGLRPEAWQIGRDDVESEPAELALLPLPHARVGDCRVDQDDARAQASSANRCRTSSSNVLRSQLATVAGVSARTDAVRGMFIASATSPK